MSFHWPVILAAALWPSHDALLPCPPVLSSASLTEHQSERSGTPHGLHRTCVGLHHSHYVIEQHFSDGCDVTVTSCDTGLRWNGTQITTIFLYIRSMNKVTWRETLLLFELTWFSNKILSLNDGWWKGSTFRFIARKNPKVTMKFHIIVWENDCFCFRAEDQQWGHMCHFECRFEAVCAWWWWWRWR